MKAICNAMGGAGVEESDAVVDASVEEESDEFWLKSGDKLGIMIPRKEVRIVMNRPICTTQY